MRNQSPGLWVSLTRSEYAGAFFMLVLAVLLALVPSVFSIRKQDKILYDSDSSRREALIARHLAATDSFFRKKRPTFVSWQRMKPGDLENLGLAAEDANRVYNKIRLGYRYASLSELSRETGIDTAILKNVISPQSFRKKQNKTQKPRSIIELNSCDTTDLIALPGIGSKTAQRIVRFRDALGGFYSKEQILETRFIDTTVLRKILPEMHVNTGIVKQISIQSAGIETLKKHPYLSEKQAKVIVKFRQQHGKLNENLLREIKIISPAELSRLLPYLNFNE